VIGERFHAALAGRYRIERELGQGGMATVYLAKDLRHDRDVAIKVLHEDLGATLGAERFLAEIKTTAKLQHPHILPLLDSGEANGLLFYVMPFVPGETLRARLDRETQLSIDDAVRIAREVADALSVAHDLGIIHRDIKPENILIQGGHALVADFGIALAVQHAGGRRMTQTGLSLGTPQYMSPEQAMGEKAVDLRADIYALGVVTYEMLTGDPPFTGSSVQAIVAKVLSAEPERPSLMRKTIPPNVEHAVLTAVAKLPADRFATAREFAAALQSTGMSPSLRRTGSTDSRHSAARRVGIVLPLAMIAAALAGWFGRGLLDTSALPDVTRLSVPVPGGITLGTGGSELPNLAISPDGRALAYVAEGKVWVRQFDRNEARVLPGSDGATDPFFSHDGSKVGFGQNRQLRWSPVEGGAVTAIAGARIAYMGSASWDEQDRVVFEAGAGIGGLQRIPVGGGTPEQLTTVTLAGEAYHKWPQVLAGGRLVLFTAVGPAGQWHDSKIILLDTETRERTVVRDHATFGRYVPNGYVLFVEETGALAALPFDLGSRKPKGEPIALESGVRLSAWGGGAMYAVADDGTLAIVRGVALNDEQLWWFDRTGRRLASLGPPTVGYQMALSPDGKSVALVSHRPGDQGISLIDVQSGQAELFTLGSDAQWSPAWSPDGARIAYASSSADGSRILVQPTVGGAPATQLYSAPRGRELWVNGWSSDSMWILVVESGPTDNDVKAMKADGSGTPIVIAASVGAEYDPAFSPDGRWVAYQGVNDIYIVSFPDTSRRFQLGPGKDPHWTRNGQELVFWRGDTLVAMALNPATGRSRTAPTALFTVPGFAAVADYDVTSDGQRFLIRLTNPDAYAPGIDIILNAFPPLRSRPQSGAK
jgi:eukaryotic-like serine/threonine-protein kinase